MPAVGFEIFLAGHDSDAHQLMRLMSVEIGFFLSGPVLASSGPIGRRLHHIYFAVDKSKAPTEGQIQTWGSSLFIRKLEIKSRKVEDNFQNGRRNE